MTDIDIERLRELLALEDMLCAQEGGPTHEDCVRFDYECACFISAHARNLLADYERLRGMEERVKGWGDAGPWTVGHELATSRVYLQSDDFRHDVRLYVTGDFADGQRVLYAEMLATVLNSLVPVPGGEGK
jgi:hypothetical protein